LNLQALTHCVDGDGLKLSMAASASQSQRCYGQEEDEGPEPVHGDLLHTNLTHEDEKVVRRLRSRRFVELDADKTLDQGRAQLN
jgi:hypothetical protein